MSSALSCFTKLEQGDLREETSESCDLIGEIYKRIIGSLKGIILNIRNVVKNTNNMVVSLSNETDNLEKSSKEQLSRIDHMASAATEISQTIIDVAKMQPTHLILLNRQMKQLKKERLLSKKLLMQCLI